MRAAMRPLLLALVAGALMFPANLSAQSAPKTISTQDLAQTKNGSNDWITFGGAQLGGGGGVGQTRMVDGQLPIADGHTYSLCRATGATLLV